MVTCAVYGCTNSSLVTTDPTIQYYFFPKHPTVVQQWIAACCWPADQIDTNTARICSIHFDSNAYTSEYKMLDYLGCYTKVLKYDAIPTLYLPNQTSLVKNNISEPETISQTPLVATEIKNIIVYTVPSAQEPAANLPFESSVVQDLITVQEETKSENEEEPSGSDEYKHIDSVEKLQQMKDENVKLQAEIKKLTPSIQKLRTKVQEKEQICKELSLELNKLLTQYNSLQASSLSLQEQKNLLAKVFSESQIKILSGKKKIYWSNDDMAMGYTIRHMSNKRLYMYLTKNLNIPLPALSSIKRWATLKKNETEKKEDKFEASD